MDPDLICCFARALREVLGRDEPPHEYWLIENFHEKPNETEILVSWVGSDMEIPGWLAHETSYEVQPRWERHYLSTRIEGRITGLSIFDRPEVKELARQYLKQRYSR